MTQIFCAHPQRSSCCSPLAAAGLRDNLAKRSETCYEQVSMGNCSHHFVQDTSSSSSANPG
jgi:hypothetical protein